MLPGAVQVLGEFFEIQGFQQVIDNAVVDCFFRIFKFAVAADDYGEDARMAFVNVSGQFQSVHAGHADVRYDDAHRIFPQKPQGVRAV